LQHLRQQRTSGTTSDGERYPLHHAPSQAQGKPGEEPRPGQRKFLGFSFTGEREPRRRIAPKAIARFKERIREQTRRTRGISLRQMVEELATYLRGWLGYFGDCQTPSVLQNLETWLRRRLRSVAWKQWKRERTRFRELRKRGVSKDLAAKTAGSPVKAEASGGRNTRRRLCTPWASFTSGAESSATACACRETKTVGPPDSGKLNVRWDGKGMVPGGSRTRPL
jgi:hypothetical protein